MSSLIGETPQKTADKVLEAITDEQYKKRWEDHPIQLFNAVAPADVSSSARKEVAQWVEALESGEYDQGQKALKKKVNDHYAYCCLGVLCEMAGVITDYHIVEDMTMPYAIRREGMEPTNLKNIFHEMSEYTFFDFELPGLLAVLNDSGVSFQQVAELLRYKYKLGDKDVTND